jgi:hypothetical protein
VPPQILAEITSLAPVVWVPVHAAFGDPGFAAVAVVPVLAVVTLAAVGPLRVDDRDSARA